ncbi:site-specific integrase [Algoriphagus sp. D3-2-R+10]|uniref:site-specific integrase n=1 Tax=Algoriphagus aurantiacus TaxID=3103948 RepID=UPI002B3BA0E6|nr:site-specific integrase [Algoriphagus sp. D3-2-R+10]MEB2774544.1 site-specific integrase [Algoriphagus sp. D3-2-R+10]
MEASLRFVLRKDLANKKGEQPIVLMVSMGGQKRKISTGIALLPELWSEERKEIDIMTSKKRAQLEMKFGDVVPPKGILVKYQAELNELKFDIQRIEESLRFSGSSYDSNEIVSIYKESKKTKIKKSDPTYSLYDFIDQYIQENSVTRAKGSMVVYKSLKKHLKNYQEKLKATIRFEDMDYSFMVGFQNFLVDWKEVHPTTGNVKTLNNITIAKQLSTLKTFLGYARRRGIKVRDGYKEYSIKKDRLEVIALNQKEFDALYALGVDSNSRLSHVKDIFLFSCVTGYRFSDLLQLKREHIKNTDIRLTITKTKEPSIVPLTRISREILKKYEERILPLPMISNQKFNKYVKELCKLAEINDPVEIIRYKGAVRDSKIYPKYELISAHTGRKTFVTLSLAKGIPAEVVMKITGHSDYKSFKRYVDVDEDRKRNAMSLAWD